MDPADKQKYLKALGLAGIALVALFPDVVLDLILSILHTLFDFLLQLVHVLFESLESVLDHIIEGLFETDLHSTQTIVFYVLLAIGIYILYKLLGIALRFYRRVALAWHDFLSHHQLNPLTYWRGLTLFEKIKIIVIPSLLIYVYVMYFM